VDVFFVLSGYLITDLLLRRAGSGSSSLVAFYAARARRLVPALLVLLAALLLFGLVALAPSDLAKLGSDLAAASTFSSNIWFALQHGSYFSPEPVSPVLHLWSLAVEEQFYLVWPLLIFWLCRFDRGRWTAVVVAGLAVGSFALWGVRGETDAGTLAFYLPDSRTWQLAGGALVALIRPWGLTRPILREGFGALGLLLLLLSFFVAFDIPGSRTRAVMAVAGAMLLIHSGRSAVTLVGRLLSTRPPVFLGAISYSLYLWHWPLLFLPSLVLSRPLSDLETVLCLLLAGVVSVLSWRYVEQPFRRGPALRIPPFRVVVSAVVGMALLAVASLSLTMLAGLPQRSSPEVRQVDAHLTQREQGIRLCGRHPDAELCQLLPANPAPDTELLAWGDSHMWHYVTALSGWSAAHGLTAGFILNPDCFPTTRSADESWTRPGCVVRNREEFAAFGSGRRVRHVVLSTHWTYDIERAAPRGGLRSSLEANLAALRSRFGPDVSILIIGPTPEFDTDPASCFVRRAMASLNLDACTFMVPANAPQAARVHVILTEVARDNPGVHLILPWSLFCDARQCLTRKDGKLLFFDDDHLNSAGAALIVPDLEAVGMILSARGGDVGSRDSVALEP
jgi:peptidoglycan/LPS O-acetylase OafA/YrhL